MKEVRESAGMDPVRQYLSEIGRHPLLKPEQELEVAYAIKAGVSARDELQEIQHLSEELGFEIDEERLLPLETAIHEGEAARERMINSNLRLVVSVAKRYQASGMPLLDLIQEGNISLFRAVEKFDPDKGFKFSTYATWWIRQGITRAIADQSRTIRIPVHMHEQLASMRWTEGVLFAKDEEITPEKLAEEMNITVEQVHKLIEARNKTKLVELDKPIGEEEDSTLADMIGIDDDTFEMVDERLKMNKLGHIALSVLDHRELTVIIKRFNESMTLEAVGNEMHVTRERIRQIESKALAKLRYSMLRNSDLLRDDHLESLIENNSGSTRDIRRRYDVSPTVLEAVRSQLDKRRQSR